MSGQPTAARVFFQPLPEHDNLNTAYFLFRLSEKVVLAPNGCWLWSGRTVGAGYGRVDCGGRKHLVHRLVYSLCVGTVRGRVEVCHDCPAGDNPACCNPAHLFVGTHTDNMRDSEAKGRNSHRAQKGEEKPQAKMTDELVRELRRRRAAGERISDLAREKGLSKAAVSEAASGKKWGHVQ